jgi:hypothetical protein
MRHPLRALALACALAATPACASLQLGQTEIKNPLSAANTLDQRAFALLHAYAAVIEEATDIVRDPATPPAITTALARAERIATPAVETMEVAVSAYVRARADFEAASDEADPVLQRAAAALTIAARRLTEATNAAQAPIGELEGLVRAGGN